MGEQGVGGALLRKASGFGEYCGSECKAAAEGSRETPEAREARLKAEAEKAAVEAAAEAEKAARQAAEKAEGLAKVQAISFDGDAKFITNSLGSLQTLAASQSGFKEVAKTVRAAAFAKFELGIRTLRSAGDIENAEYFKKQLKSMKRKAFLTNPAFLYAAGTALMLIIGLIAHNFAK
jgi:hypothetical protein